MFIRSLETKPAARISREPFDLESPNFTRTSILTYYIATPDMQSLTTSCQKLSQKMSKMLPSMASAGISREQFKQGPYAAITDEDI